MRFDTPLAVDGAAEDQTTILFQKASNKLRYPHLPFSAQNLLAPGSSFLSKALSEPCLQSLLLSQDPSSRKGASLTFLDAILPMHAGDQKHRTRHTKKHELSVRCFRSPPCHASEVNIPTASLHGKSSGSIRDNRRKLVRGRPNRTLLSHKIMGLLRYD